MLLIHYFYEFVERYQDICAFVNLNQDLFELESLYASKNVNDWSLLVSLLTQGPFDCGLTNLQKDMTMSRESSCRFWEVSAQNLKNLNNPG